MEENTQLPKEVVEQIEKEAEAHNARLKEHAENEKDVAYAQGFAEGWHEGVIAYATQLHQLQEETLKTYRDWYTLHKEHIKAKALLQEVFEKHESGLLPDRFIYEKIKTFLYGE